MRTVGFFVAAAFLTAPVAAQSGSLTGRVDAATLREVQPALDVASRDSLPVAALESKVLEGVAKRRPPAQIGQVVRELADELRAARATLRASAPGRPIVDGEVVAAAQATRQGIGPEVVGRLLTADASGASMEIPVTVLTELVRRGIPIDEAAAAMDLVVREGVPMEIAAQIPGRIDRGRGRGAGAEPPGQALGRALRDLNIQGGRGRGQNE